MFVKNKYVFIGVFDYLEIYIFDKMKRLWYNVDTTLNLNIFSLPTKCHFYFGKNVDFYFRISCVMRIDLVWLRTLCYYGGMFEAKMECPVCGEKFDEECVEFLDNGNPACPDCVAEERREDEQKTN